MVPFLPGLQYCCTTHGNRHVRSAGAALLGALVSSCVRSSHPLHTALLLNSDSKLGTVIGDALQATLADNWSQVRMAGSVLCWGYVLALMQIVIVNNTAPTMKTRRWLHPSRLQWVT